MPAIGRVSVFFAGAITYLILGTLAATVLWMFVSGRHTKPITGYYYGSVGAIFDQHEKRPFFWFKIRAQTEPRWYWLRPHSFSYRLAKVEWFTPGVDMQRAELDLQSMTYQHGSDSGSFTRDVLMAWIASPDEDAEKQRALESSTHLFGWLRRIGSGEAPGPQHHNRYFDEPCRIRYSHGVLGSGVPDTVYIWLAIWVWLVRSRWRQMFCTRVASTKTVEPTGTSSSSSDLTTSHTSGESPGGSPRR